MDIKANDEIAAKQIKIHWLPQEKKKIMEIWGWNWLHVIHGEEEERRSVNGMIMWLKFFRWAVTFLGSMDMNESL